MDLCVGGKLLPKARMADSDFEATEVEATTESQHVTTPVVSGVTIPPEQIRGKPLLEIDDVPPPFAYHHLIQGSCFHAPFEILNGHAMIGRLHNQGSRH